MKRLIALVLCCLLCLCGCEWSALQTTGAADGVFTVYYMDVGQADCALVSLPDGRTILIDAGKNATAQQLAADIRKLGVVRLDYVIGTHPHEDHIGGLDVMIEQFDVGAVYMPKVSSDTKTFLDVLEAVQEKGLKVQTARAGKVLLEEAGVYADFLGPNSEKYDDLNNYSAVLRIRFGSRTFLFTGDAEALSEQEMLAAYDVLSADVLKVGHHGSKTSSSAAFVNAVNPAYAVICVGEDNSYGHPSDEVLERLAGAAVYRTDVNGRITMRCDGETIEVRTEK